MGRRLAVTSMLAVVVALAGVTPASATTDDGASVSMLDDVFEEEIVRVDAGDTVEWVNDGGSPHDVTADDGSWSSGTLEPGTEFNHIFETEGIYAYHCSLHGTPGAGMTGIVVVGDVPLLGPSGGVGPGEEPVPGVLGERLRVPEDHPTIQEAVDHAEPGGTILVAPGVYEETVTVTVPYLTIRGLDRNETIVDGGFKRANGIQVIEADGVAIENMTARNHVLNGFYWSRVHGYRGSYLTAYNNGEHGIYAFASDWGQFDHSYAGGNADSGFSIGQCDPCHALVTDVLAENNAVGFSGTNASGDLRIINSEWRYNMGGIALNTLDSELLPPQGDIVIAGNHVHHNNDLDAPAKGLTSVAFGKGIVVTGGVGNRVVGNLVEDHEEYGIVLIPMVDRNVWLTSRNEVTDNVVRRSGLADLALGAPSSGSDCFGGNDHSTSQPPAIQLLYPCDGSSPFPGGGGSMGPTITSVVRLVDGLDGDFPHGDWRTQPAPPPQDQMPGDPAVAPARPAIADQSVPEFAVYPIRSTSEIAPSSGPEVSKEVAIMGLPLATSWWGLLIGLYGYVLPFVLYAAWVAVALWDLIRQESVGLPHRTRWMLIVLVVPFVGPLLYFAFGGSPIPRQLRLILTAGGVAVYALFVMLGVLVGS